MRRLIFVLACCTLFVQQASAQWKKIADFLDSKGESIQVNCIYFLDLPGPPRVGYTSASLLYKTTDGGTSWSENVTGSGDFLDIYFRDTIIGWAVGIDKPVRTTDGGNTWQQLNLPVRVKWSSSYYYPYQFAVYYSDFSKKLFLGLEDSVMLVSSDSGETWHRTNILSVAGFAFSTPKDGILMTNPVLDDSHHPFRWIDSLSHVYITSDGGNSWRLGSQPFPSVFAKQQPLAIPDTCIYFQICGIKYNDTVGETMAVFRSDDSGMTWKKIYTFPNFVIPFEVIRGDLNRMYVQTIDSGMYASTDKGISWYPTGGPSWAYGGTESPRFYSKNGVTIAARYIKSSQKFDGLWERIDPLESVEPDLYSSRAAVYPNPAYDRITLDLEAPATYEVRDVLGVVRMKGKCDGQSVTLDVSSLPEGVYYMSSGKQRVKFVKQ